MYTYKHTHTHTHTHIPDSVETVHRLPLLPNNTTSEAFLHKSEAVWSVDWIFIIAVTERVSDIEQNVLKFSF